jgi:hypothetical protein
LLHCKSKVLTLCNAERLIQHIYNRPSDMWTVLYSISLNTLFIILTKV